MSAMSYQQTASDRGFQVEKLRHSLPLGDHLAALSLQTCARVWWCVVREKVPASGGVKVPARQRLAMRSLVGGVMAACRRVLLRWWL